MAEEPWHLKAAHELKGTITPLHSNGNKVYGHKVEHDSFAPYEVIFTRDDNKVGARIHKTVQGSNRRVLTVYQNGSIKVCAAGLTHVKTIEGLAEANPKSTRLKDIPKLLIAARATHAALVKHAPK